MSRTADRLAAVRRRTRGDAGGDAGFTLIEVIVSLTLFSIVASAAAGMIVTGLRTSLVSKLDTGAKNLSQERLEIMRNLPFHIDRDPAATTPDSSDLLDIYYRNTTTASSTTTNGYVAACGAQTTTCTSRPAWDPSSGSFYRYVLDPVPGFAKYKQYIATQFLNDQRVPLSPGTYDSQTSGSDSGPSQFVGVTVTTYWTVGQLTKSFQLQTFISAGRPGASQVVAQGRAAAVKFSGGLDTSRLLTMNLGVVNVDGALAVGSTSAAQAAGAQADITESQHVDGARASAQAPPNTTATLGSDSAKELLEGTVSVAHFGTTASSNVSALVTGGLPAVGTSALPVTGQVSAHGVGSTPVWFTPLPSPAAHLRIDTTKPLMWIDQTTGGAIVAKSTGYIAATTGTGHSVTSNVTGNALTVKMFPTSFAPNGVVQVTLSASSLTCTTTGAAGSATLTYTATVAYWNGSSYTTVSLDQSQSTSPLASVNLATTQVGTDSSSLPIYLGEYVTGWSSLTTGTIASGKTVEGDNNRAEASYDGIVKVTAATMRPSDPTSTSGVIAGSLSCIAEDNR